MPEQKTDAEWKYNPEDNSYPGENQKMPQSSQAISWTASEFIDKHKSAGWYLIFIIVTILLSAGIFFFTTDYMSTAAVAAAGIIFIFVISKKPKQLSYEVNDKGIQVGSKFYNYGMFRSFNLAQDGGVKSIELIPAKRFMPDMSIYFPPDQETVIISLLASHLPHDERVEKMADRLAKKFRF